MITLDDRGQIIDIEMPRFNLVWETGEHFNTLVKDGLFGANFLFHKDRLGPGTYDDVFTDLGFSGVRYPGGTVAEKYFDIRNPDAPFTVDKQTVVQLTPYREFLTWAGSAGAKVDIVIPTSRFLQGTNGDRSVTKETFRTVKKFVTDTLTGKYGDAHVGSFEVGNEYFLSGEMNAVEYARVINTVATAIQDGINWYRKATHQPANWDEPEIVIQAGQVGKYSSDPGWVQNDYLLGAIDRKAAKAIDAVNIHYYTRGTFDDLPNHDYYFDRLDSWSKNPCFSKVEFFMTEWSVQIGDTQEVGLKQGSTLLWMLSQMVARGVDVAHIWPLQQNTENDLAGREGATKYTVSGAVMKLANETLPGSVFQERLTYDGGVAYLFERDGNKVVFVASRDGTAHDVTLDISGFFTDSAYVTSRIVGTNDRIDLPNAVPVTETLTTKEHPTSYDVHLDPYEIAVVTFQTVPALISGSVAPIALTGTSGRDTLAGGGGADTLRGAGGHDVISGAGGADTIDGGAGNDFLVGGTGNDRITTGTGHDTLVFTATSGSDRVTDFDALADRLIFDGLDSADLSISKVSDGALIAWDGGQIHLTGVSAAALAVEHFFFV